MKNLRNLFLLSVMLITSMTIAQTTITGVIIDGDSNQPLPSANVMVKGTQSGSTTDFDGKFEFSTDANSGQLVISYLGYVTKTVAFTANSKVTKVGNIVLQADANQLSEVVLVGRGVIDLADDRKTPIAVSTVTAAEIQAKTGNFDLPEVLKSTPSVQNVKGGGFGDGEMYLRGFDQTNTAFLLNGQPINGMEDGKMYWSNWSGVLDIANAVQVQRGLGSSKLAISSVGGTVNIVTKTIDQKKGGFVQQMIGNDDYTKTTAYFSTGMLENGLAVSGLLGHWQGDGYMDGTAGQGQTYFLSFGYKAGKKDVLNFLVTGAPQWHGTTREQNLSTLREKGRRYSNNYGYVNGQYYAGGRNFYHKPIINLNWDHTFSEDTSLSTVAYGSLGRGGFAFLSGVGRNDEGLYDFDGAIANGQGYAKSSVNAHNWFGVISNLETQINENLSLNGGFDARMYKGKHYRELTDTFGATSVDQSNDFIGSYTVTEANGFNPWNALFNSTEDNQKIDRNYQEQINYAGVFGQAEYATDLFSAYTQFAVSNQSHQREGFWATEGLGKSDKVNNVGYNVKVGAAFNINENNKVFANGGYYSRQPYHDDLFTNNRYSNQLNPFADQNQNITGLEAGYQFKSQYIKANLNVYHTIWDNRILFGADDVDNDGVDDLFSQSSPAKQVHSGLELELFAYPTNNLTIQGFASYGDWKYDGNVTTNDYDDLGNLVAAGNTKYIDGVEIGNVAQFTAGLGVNYEILRNFKIDANANMYDNIFGNTDLGSSQWEDEDNKGAIELPSYTTVDAGLSYKWLLGKEDQNNIQFRFNLNNVFDEYFIERSRDNNHLEAGDESWNGVNTSNRVRLGYGRTWNFSVRYNF